MENKSFNIIHYLESSHKDEIKKQERSIRLPIILISLSLLLIVIASTSIIPHGYLSLSIIIVGVIALIFGLILIFNAKVTHKYEFLFIPSNEILKKETIYFRPSDLQKLHNCLESGNMNCLREIKPELDSACYLEVVGTEKGRFYCVQLMEYIPYEYEATTPVIEIDGDNAEIISELIKKKN